MWWFNFILLKKLCISKSHDTIPFSIPEGWPVSIRTAASAPWLSWKQHTRIFITRHFRLYKPILYKKIFRESSHFSDYFVNKCCNLRLFYDFITNKWKKWKAYFKAGTQALLVIRISGYKNHFCQYDCYRPECSPSCREAKSMGIRNPQPC